jgi:hypothetical protein
MPDPDEIFRATQDVIERLLKVADELRRMAAATRTVIATSREALEMKASAQRPPTRREPDRAAAGPEADSELM